MNNLSITFTGYYEDHRKFTVDFRKGLTTVIGKNGSGKTSMIREMDDILHRDNIPHYTYIQNDKGPKLFHSGLMSGGSSFATSNEYFLSSEGERILVTYGAMITTIKQFLETNKDEDIVVLLFDGLDSGLSINNIHSIRDIFNLMINDYPNVCIINTANNYEFVKDTRCVHARTGRDVSIKTYNDFVRFLTK